MDIYVLLREWYRNADFVEALLDGLCQAEIHGPVIRRLHPRTQNEIHAAVSEFGNSDSDRWVAENTIVGGDETFQEPRWPIDLMYGRLGVACLDDAWCRERWTAAVWDTVDIAKDAGWIDRLDAFEDELVPLLIADEFSLLPVSTSTREIGEIRGFLRERVQDLEIQNRVGAG